MLRTEPPAARPAPAPPASDAPVALSEQAAELAQSLRHRLGVAVTALEAELGSGPAAGDAPELVTSLASPEGLVLGQPPLAAQKVLAATRNPDLGLNKLVALIEQDPTLSQSLLKFANSAYYSTGGPPLVSIPDSVRRVGSTGLNSVVLGCVVKGVLCRPGPGYDDMVQQVWQHLVRSAPIARTLAPAFDVTPDEAYAIALLHDVGKLAVFHRMAAIRGKHRRDLVFAPGALARVLRHLHEPLGALAALEWGLGTRAAEAIAAHHRSPAPEKALPLSEVVCLAERIDIAAVNGREPELDAWWSDAGLSGSRPRVEQILASLAAEPQVSAA